MTLSIVIISYNGLNHTLRCLDSLTPILMKHDDYDVVLVDNGSDDGLLGEIDSRHYPYADRLKVIRLDNNLGVAGGRNVGLRASQNSRYIMLLDNDTIANADAIESMLSFLDENPEVGLVAPCLKSPSGEVQISFKRFPGIGEKFLNLIGRKNTLVQPPSVQRLEPFYVIGACQMFRGSILNRIGMLDDKIFFGPEDADFCMRIRETGQKIVYLPTVSIIHDWQRDSRKSPFSATSLRHVKGLLYFYRKWRRWV